MQWLLHCKRFDIWRKQTKGAKNKQKKISRQWHIKTPQEMKIKYDYQNIQRVTEVAVRRIRL